MLDPFDQGDPAKVLLSHVIYKLLFFTAAMVCVPIGSYFVTLNTIFGGP